MGVSVAVIKLHDKGIPNDTSPTRPHLLFLPKQLHQLRMPYSNIYILAGAILIQTNAEGKQELAQERISTAGEICCEKRQRQRE